MDTEAALSSSDHAVEHGELSVPSGGAEPCDRADTTPDGRPGQTKTVSEPLRHWLRDLATRLDPFARNADVLLDEERLASGEDVFGVVLVPDQSEPHTFGKVLRTFSAYSGPGLLIAVGYMDPGNWSTNLAGGSQFGYDLLCVIVLANILGAVLQHLAVRLGAGSSLDLAQACRQRYHPYVNKVLWLIIEGAMIATDLAEVLGGAIGFNILLRIPLVGGALISIADVFLFLLLRGQRARVVEACVLVLMLLIMACLIFALIKTNAPTAAVVAGLAPKGRIVTNKDELYAAIGILGATVMPHNLFLHSSAILSRRFDKSDAGRRQALVYGTVDSTIALVIATFVNAALLIVAAGTFAATVGAISDLGQAAELLKPALGRAASTLFGLGLLASGQQSTLTCTLAGQVVLEGFLGPTAALKPWARRMVTRFVAAVPAVIVSSVGGAAGVTRLLVLSQVILSLSLPFAIFPLVHLCGKRDLLGDLASPRALSALSWCMWGFITALNAKLVIDFATA